MILKIEKAKACQTLEQMKSKSETKTNQASPTSSAASPLLQEMIVLFQIKIQDNFFHKSKIHRFIVMMMVKNNTYFVTYGIHPVQLALLYM